MSESKTGPFPNVPYDIVNVENVTAKNVRCHYKAWICWASLNALKLGILVSFILFIIVPIVYMYSYSFQRAMMFLNFLNVPSGADYQHPEKYGLKGSRNLYIAAGNVTLGTWQILPESLENVNKTGEDFFDKILDDGQNILIYNHGVGGCRLTPERIHVYQVLRKLFHVIAYVYRSFGDSSPQPPSELALVEDIFSVFQWVRNRTKSNVFIWGHSLGTSLKIQNVGIEKPSGLILESSFSSSRDELWESPLTKMFRFLPWFEATIVRPTAKHFPFETEKYICDINLPILMLHAEDDDTIPIKLAHKLYKAAQKCRTDSQGRIMFHYFSADKKYGHTYTYKAPDLPDKISAFLQMVSETRGSQNRTTS